MKRSVGNTVEAGPWKMVKRLVLSRFLLQESYMIVQTFPIDSPALLVHGVTGDALLPEINPRLFLRVDRAHAGS